MITAQRNNPRQHAILQRRPWLPRMRLWLPRQQRIVSTLDLLDGVVVVIRSHRDIAAIQHPRPGVERVCFEWDVVPAAEANPA